MPAFDVLGDGYRLRMDGLELVLHACTAAAVRAGRRTRDCQRRWRHAVRGDVQRLRPARPSGPRHASGCPAPPGDHELGGGPAVLPGRPRRRADRRRRHRPSDDPLPTAETFFDVEGLRLPREHPAIVFGDGGSLKSYLALFAAGKLRQRGVSVLYADWELSADEHRVRLGEIFGEDARPTLLYARCDRPLTSEIPPTPPAPPGARDRLHGVRLRGVRLRWSAGSRESRRALHAGRPPVGDSHTAPGPHEQVRDRPREAVRQLVLAQRRPAHLARQTRSQPLVRTTSTITSPSSAWSVFTHGRRTSAGWGRPWGSASPSAASVPTSRV